MCSLGAGLLFAQGFFFGCLRSLPSIYGLPPLGSFVYAFSPLPLHASVLKPDFDLPNRSGHTLIQARFKESSIRSILMNQNIYFIIYVKMGESCGTYGGEERCIRGFGR